MNVLIEDGTAQSTAVPISTLFNFVYSTTNDYAITIGNPFTTMMDLNVDISSGNIGRTLTFTGVGFDSFDANSNLKHTYNTASDLNLIYRHNWIGNAPQSRNEFAAAGSLSNLLWGIYMNVDYGNLGCFNSGSPCSFVLGGRNFDTRLVDYSPVADLFDNVTFDSYGLYWNPDITISSVSAIFNNFPIWLESGLVVFDNDETKILFGEDADVNITYLAGNTLEIEGSLNATGIICDSVGCIGSGSGDINVTVNVTTINVSLLSITVTSDSTSSDSDYNVFDEDNYASFTYINNTEWIDFIYTPTDGRFEIEVAGDYMINPLVYLRVDSGTTEVSMRIAVNSVDVFDHRVSSTHGSVDPELNEISIIKSLSIGDNITVFVDNSDLDGIAVQDGSTMNIWRLSNSITESTSGGSGFGIFNISQVRTLNTTTFSTLSWVSDPWLKFDVESGGNYTFEFNIFASGGSDSVVVNVSAPSSASNFVYGYNFNDGSIRGLESAGNTDASVTPWEIEIRGSFTADASGELAVNYDMQSAIATTDIIKGSYGILRRT